MKKILLVILCGSGILVASAQDHITVHRSLTWEGQSTLVQGTEASPVPGSKMAPSVGNVTNPLSEPVTNSGKMTPCKECITNDQKDNLPYFVDNIELHQDGHLTVTIQNAIYETVQNNDELLQNKFIGSEVQITSNIGYLKGQPRALVSLLPLRKNSMTGNIERLVSFDLNLSVAPNYHKQRSSSMVYASNSVLASGNWYKLGVSRSGIFKLSYSFLQSLGIPVDQIDPRNIRIYGNGGGMLPQKNDAPRYDDLQEDAIEVVGENDGVFNSGDYVLFYGQSPETWALDTADTRFHHVPNLYSDYTYYFITTDLGVGKRIQPAASEASSTTTVTSFDDYQVHDLDKVNLIQSGSDWWGESFDFVTTTQNFTFSFPNIIAATPVYLKTRVAGRSTVSQSTFTTLVNGTQILSQTTNTVGADFTDTFADQKTASTTFTTNSGDLNVTVNYNNPSSGAAGWLDYIELNVRRSLAMTSTQIFFRDKNSVGAGSIPQFSISNAGAGMSVWDVTDPINVKLQSGNLNGSTFSFNAKADQLKEYSSFYDSGAFTEVTTFGSVANQDLHSRNQVELIIVAYPDFIQQARRLAGYHHDNDGLDTLVVTPETIYNEFSSGAPDASALRNFAKMFFDRAEGDTSMMPKYMCLVGDGSYDNKNRVAGNTNFIITYQSPQSLSPTSTFTSDDYFGLLDDGEGANITDANDLIDIAIGRLPVKTPQEAKDVVDKICHYQSTSSFGSWRNVVCFIADDEDNDTHINEADQVAHIVEDNYPVYNVDKIYLDAYQQESTPGGQRYPDVNAAISNRVFSGSLIMNYTGHGGTGGLAHERILGTSDINSWTNIDKLSCWVTATCEFSRYDDPAKVSAGEQLLLNPRGGAIALVTTTRIVYSDANYSLNSAWINHVFEPYNGRYPTLGEIMSTAKNSLIGGGTDPENTRKFALLGDPALTLAYPKYDVTTTFVNNHDITSYTDTLKALAKVTIKGEVRDLNDQKMTGFSGIVYPTIYDKKQIVSTLGQDPGSPKKNFDLQKNIIYRGKATVTNGDFEYTFVVPKDISYNFGKAKISYYADNGIVDAKGYNDQVLIGGTASNYAEDNVGPDIKIFMNDENFVSGGMTDENPVLLLKLNDANGINTVGNGIGHDITAQIDADSKDTKVLNDFYEAALNDYQSGSVTYPIYKLEDGPHVINVKAWDVYNNSSEKAVDFIVASSSTLALDHVLNYPNPFTTKTGFMFEHNRPGDVLRGQVRIFTISGKLVKTLTFNLSGETITGDGCGSDATVTKGYRVAGIDWDGTDDYGDQLARGVYVYEVEVTSATDGQKASKFEKLVLLK